MSDTPPFTQAPRTPDLHYDAQGRPWFRAADGKWVQATAEASRPPPPLQAPFDIVNTAVAPQTSPYTFGPFSTFNPSGPPHASSSAHPFPNHAIDPHLVSLPQDDDLALSKPSAIAESRGLQPAPKVAGQRQRQKRKRRHDTSDSEDESDVGEPAPKRARAGRPHGSVNFAREDTTKLLDLTEKKLPLGAKAWKAIAHSFNKWAPTNSRPKRDQKSLEAKFKQLVKKKKPTGDGVPPPEVKRAQRIERLINQRVDVRDLSDSEIDGGAVDGDASDGSDDSVQVVGSGSTLHTAVAHRAPTPPLRRSRTTAPRMNAPDLINKLTKTFDPDVQKARDDDRNDRSFQMTQYLALSQQLRDSQASNESLRNQLLSMQTRLHQAESARSLAEFKVHMLANGGPEGGYGVAPPRVRVNSASRALHHPDLVRVNGAIRSEQFFPGGGACTEWHSDPSEPSENEAEKENIDPMSSFDPTSSSSSRRTSVHHDDFRSDYDADELTAPVTTDAPKEAPDFVQGSSRDGTA